MPFMTRITSPGSASARRVPAVAPAASSRRIAPRMSSRVSAKSGESEPAAARSALPMERLVAM